MSGHHYAVEGRSAIEVTHLALLGVKIAGPAFWEYFYKRKYGPDVTKEWQKVQKTLLVYRRTKKLQKIWTTKVHAKEEVNVNRFYTKAIRNRR